MADVLFILLLAAFFAVAGLFVRLCERIVGPDDLVAVPHEGVGTTDEVKVA